MIQSNSSQLSVSGFIRFESRKDVKEKDIRQIVACHIASHVISSQSSATMYKIPDDVLNHLYRRFFTVDEEELGDLMQICYRVEQAHWYYNKWYGLDLTQNGLLSEASLKPCGFQEVLENFLSYLTKKGVSIPKFDDIDSVSDKFTEFRTRFPLCGAVVLNEEMDQVLLVKVGQDCWSFPNVTKHRFEGSSYCAIRAVSLSAGYDIPIRNFHNENLIQDTIGQTRMQLYIVKYETGKHNKTPKQLCSKWCAQWFNVADIPFNNSDSSFSPDKFRAVFPFMSRILNWINCQRCERTLGQSDFDQSTNL